MLSHFLESDRIRLPEGAPWRLIPISPTLEWRIARHRSMGRIAVDWLI